MVALLPFALTAATADFWSKPRGAVVDVLRAFWLSVACFPAPEGLRLAGLATLCLSSFGWGHWPAVGVWPFPLLLKLFY